MNPNQGSHHQHPLHSHGNPNNPYPSQSESKRKLSGNRMYHNESEPPHVQVQGMQPQQQCGHSTPIPPGWVKSHPSSQQVHHQSMTGNCSSPSSSNYGAPNNYLQQQSFYPNDHSSETTSVGSPMRPPPGPSYPSVNNNSSSPCPYYPENHGGTDYYQHQFNNFESSVKNNRRMGEESSISSHGNFYTSAPPPSFYSQQQQYPEFPSSSEYSRMVYASGNNNVNNSNNTVVNSAAADYFTGPSNSRPSSCSSYGHHHVSTPLEFHHQHQPHLQQNQQQPFRRNSIESFSSEPGEGRYGGYGGTTHPPLTNSRFNPHLIKREPVIPPSWSNEHGTSQEEQDGYFYGTSGGGGAQHQYHRPPQSISAHSHNRCGDGTPPLTGSHTPQPPHSFEKSSCSYVESSDGNYSKKVIKHRSQSVSYSRNYDHLQHFRTGISSSTQYQQHQSHENLSVVPPPLKDVPAVSEFQDSSMGGGDSVSRTGRGNFPTGAAGHIPSGVVTREGGCDDDDGEEDGGSDSESSSPKSNSDHEEEGDNMSDLEEELKKEIESVTTTTGGGGGTKLSESDKEISEVELTVVEPTTGSPETKIEEGDDNELSNSSLTLFDSIALNTFDSPSEDVTGNSDTEIVDNECPSTQGDLLEEDQDSLSGLSSISSHERSRFHHHLRPHSNSSTCGGGEERSRSVSPGPQKIMKRSFSEADKELVVNTTAISAAALAYSSQAFIQVPSGWTREITISPTNPTSSYVFYTSPSDTKLRTLDEVKNYITSDGTCKCGLSCPLHLEVAFSFDPKVTNSYGEGDEVNLVNLNEDGKRRLCCNQKRKIPLSEDSPLISSTRDDLGDSGDGERRSLSSKKRRTELLSVEQNPSTVVIKEPETQNTSLIMIPKSSTSSSMTPVTYYNQNVSVPFAQQSPDTTTQTPQRDMSPASSVSSDTSVTLNCLSSSSTPTPVGIKTSPNSGNATTAMSTPPGKGSEFAWPTPPSTAVRPHTPPASWPSTSPKKSTNYQHHLISKSPIKRPLSPCPNINVRQIPLEQNLPPPRPGQETSPISITPVGASHPNQSQQQPSPSVSLVPILNASTGGQETPSSLSNLNTGFSISPVLPGQSNTLQFTSILPSTSYCHQSFGGIGMPKLVTSSAPIPSTGIQPQIPSSITISMVGQESQSQNSVTLPKLVQKIGPSIEENSIKSPLKLVQNASSGRFEGTNLENSIEGNQEQKKEETAMVIDENQSLESKILKIIADAASASGKIPESTNVTPSGMTTPLLPKQANGHGKGVRCGVLNMLPVSSVPPPMSSLPLISTPPISIHSLPQTIFTSNATTITTTSSSNLPIMTSSSIINCGNGSNLGVNTSNTGLNLNHGNQLILQPPSDPNNPSLRYPFFQTLQPIFLNPSGGPGPLLIPNASDPQSFIQIDQNGQPTTGNPGDLIQQGTTMVIDPNSMSMCGNGNIIQGGGPPGPKKKKKRLSKKQQQQQAQLQLQQQLLLQQLFNHQQVQQQHVQAAQQQIPLLLPQSFNLGPQGFLQPMNMNMNMNFFPTPTILTLPNLILNPADGTLFIQQSPISSAAGTQATQMPPQLKITQGGVPIQAAASAGCPQNMTVGKSSSSTSGSSDGGKSSSGSELVVDDSSRQNATPDSSTNDCQLGFIPSSNSTTTSQIQQQQPPAPMTVSLPLGSSTNLQGSKKGPIKSKVVSSSTMGTVHKRILPQKQILPKIDSTTPSVENN